MLSDYLFNLSKSSAAKNTLLKIPRIKKAKERFIAGETLEEAIDAVKKLKQIGCQATINKLGEYVEDEKEAIEAKEDYLEIMERISRENLINTQVSLKLTQMGLDCKKELCLENLKEILRAARFRKNTVQIDMEDYSHREKTLEIFKELKKNYNNVGQCLQANLRRTESDIVNLIPLSPNIRLVKGAYKESENVSFSKKSDVDKNYIRLSKLLLSKYSLEHKTYPCFATHDTKIIEWIIKFTSLYQIPKDKFEFQMLYGVRSDLQKLLTGQGYTVRIYTSFGEDWYPYFMRRVAERPANLWFAMKQILSH